MSCLFIHGWVDLRCLTAPLSAAILAGNLRTPPLPWREIYYLSPRPQPVRVRISKHSHTTHNTYISHTKIQLALLRLRERCNKFVERAYDNPFSHSVCVCAHNIIKSSRRKDHQHECLMLAGCLASLSGPTGRCSLCQYVRARLHHHPSPRAYCF